MLSFIWFLAFPFFFMWLLGVRRAGWIGFACVIVVLVLALGFITGLLFTFFVEPQSYWQAYRLPELTTNAYADSLNLGDPLYKLLVIPYLALYDAMKVYLHFSLTHGTVALWIPELISFAILRNLYAISVYLRPPVSSC